MLDFALSCYSKGALIGENLQNYVLTLGEPMKCDNVLTKGCEPTILNCLEDGPSGDVFNLFFFFPLNINCVSLLSTIQVAG
jgi:hypothetical protein